LPGTNVPAYFASLSITKKKKFYDIDNWWENNATIEDWFDEMVGQVKHGALW
jgi:hypothetical protein